jgi:hypothetical protein
LSRSIGITDVRGLQVLSGVTGYVVEIEIGSREAIDQWRSLPDPWLQLWQ